MVVFSPDLVEIDQITEPQGTEALQVLPQGGFHLFNDRTLYFYQLSVKKKYQPKTKNPRQ